MIRTQEIRATQPKDLLDSLNRESGRIYSLTMVTHWRAYRKNEVWLSPRGAERLNDSLHGGTTLHAHSCDAAQQGFYKACKTARTNRREDGSARFPHKRKYYRTTVWKKAGIRVENKIIKLARARGLCPVQVCIPFEIGENAEILEVRLVFNHKAKRYSWHLVLEDGLKMPLVPGYKVAGLDQGEIHPAVVSTHESACVITARELRSNTQYRVKKKAEIQKRQARCVKKSKMWWRLQRRWNKIRRQCDRRQRDILHKVSREVADWCLVNGVGLLVMGDTRNIGNGKRLHKKSQQKISQWPHGKLRDYITYKCEANGTQTMLHSEKYTSQTCLKCMKRNKTKDRNYLCRRCGFEGHRDVVGSSNIRTFKLFGSPGGSYPDHVGFRQPYKVSRSRPSSQPDTLQVAGEQLSLLSEAAGF